MTELARPILIHCDPGTDDAIALFFALASPELDVRLVTAVGGNVGLAHTQAARAAADTDRLISPLALGREFSSPRSQETTL